jgi:AraC family transcriptional regulator
VDHPHPAPSHVIEAELATSLASVSLNRAHWLGPIDHVARADFHHLQLSLLPQDRGRGCYLDRWSRNRFEPIGSLFLTPAEQRLHARSNCRDQQSIVCRFTNDALERWFDDGVGWSDRRLEASLDMAHPEIRRLLLRIGRELRTPSLASEAIIELLSAQIVIEISRYLLGVEEPRGSTGLAPWRLRLVDDYLAEHAPEASLGDVAKACGLSVRQLTRAFRAARGRSIGDYITELKVERAQRLLTSGMPIKVLAADLGFSSASAFSTAFQRATGESPGAYRRRMVHG